VSSIRRKAEGLFTTPHSNLLRQLALYSIGVGGNPTFYANLLMLLLMITAYKYLKLGLRRNICMYTYRLRNVGTCGWESRNTSTKPSIEHAQTPWPIEVSMVCLLRRQHRRSRSTHYVPGRNARLVLLCSGTYQRIPARIFDQCFHSTVNSQ